MFEKLFEIFKELITYTSGDFDEAIDWLKELDKEYVLTSPDYTMDDFIEELLNKENVEADNVLNHKFLFEDIMMFDEKPTDSVRLSAATIEELFNVEIQHHSLYFYGSKKQIEQK